MPLGMSRSNVSIEELKKSSNTAIGYELIKDDIISKMEYYNIAGMEPTGSINSSVNDMANWLITWINKRKFNGQQILPEAYINEAISSQMLIKSALPNKEYPDIYLSICGMRGLFPHTRDVTKLSVVETLMVFLLTFLFFQVIMLGLLF